MSKHNRTQKLVIQGTTIYQGIASENQSPFGFFGLQSRLAEQSAKEAQKLTSEFLKPVGKSHTEVQAEITARTLVMQWTNNPEELIW